MATRVTHTHMKLWTDQDDLWRGDSAVYSALVHGWWPGGATAASVRETVARAEADGTPFSHDEQQVLEAWALYAVDGGLVGLW